MQGREDKFWIRTGVEHGQIFVSVEDNGPGVPADIMPRLFEPFFTNKDQGTGLGLTIAFNLVEANGGRLEAVAPEGNGARFVMRFPIAETTP